MSASDAFGPGKFPQLDTEGWRETSPRDPGYNCIAWVAGDSSRHWWPPDSPPLIHWPIEGGDDSIDGFLQAFQALGFQRCEHGEVEEGQEKVAFYADAGGVTHASRQLLSGVWTSKVGKNFDIEHTLAGLEGGEYGSVAAFMKRPRAGVPELSVIRVGEPSSLKAWAKSIKAETLALYLAVRDPRTPWYAKALGVCVVAYALSPIDLIPDFIPVIGYLDDIVIVPAGLWAVRRLIPAHVLAEARERAANAEAQRSRTAAAVIVAIWILAVALTGAVLWRALR